MVNTVNIIFKDYLKMEFTSHTIERIVFVLDNQQGCPDVMCKPGI